MSAARILVVDDESSLLLTLVANLELEGFEVLAAASAEEALAILSATPVDLVLSDIRMPGMNGVDLFREIRRRTPETPVVLMTAFALEELVTAAVHEGVFTVLPKTFDVPHLIRTLSVALRRPVVLVVDDSREVAETMVAALDAMGVRARFALDGESALLALGEGVAIDVCVVDLVMPGMTGPQLVERLKAMDPRIVCIAMSGYNVPEMLRAVARRVDGFMQKPVPAERLVDAVARVRAGGRR